MNLRHLGALAVLFLVVVFSFQNCSDVQFVNEQASLTAKCVDLTVDDVKPKLKWSWIDHLDLNDADQFPDYTQVMSTPMVGDLNGDKRPEVVFVTFANGAYNSRGVLRIVDGATGETIKSVGSDELAPFGSAAPLLIDIDGDGKAEIAYPHYDQKSIVVLNFDGSKRWVLKTGDTLSTHRGFSAFDMDKDGKAEIFVGNAAYSEDASAQPIKKWHAANSVESGWEYMMNLDPAHPDKAFAVTNRGLFDASGALVYPLTGQGATVADIDGVSGMELVESGSGQLRIRDALSGTLKTDVDLNLYNDLKCTGGIGGGPATLGDFDGDPATVEIALATGRYLTIFNSAGQLIAKSPTQDCSSLATGISSFDFNGDGKPEILYGDEEYFRIFEMHEGELRVIWSTPNPSGTLNEYPVVADVDGNGSSEIVVASNNYAVSGFYTDPSEAADKDVARAITGVRVFESAKANSWMPTRKVWNQFDYNPAFVTDALRPVSSTPLSGSFTTRIFRRNAQLGVFEQRCE